MNAANRTVFRVLGALQNPGRWLIMSIFFLCLVIIGTIGFQIIAGEHSVITDMGKGSDPPPVISQAEAQSNRLYILSHILRSDGTNGAVGGQITVLEAATRQVVNTIKTGVDVDAVLAPDGSRLYVAAVDVGEGNTDHLFAVDTGTGVELWRVALNNRIKYIFDGPTGLALSTTGRWLYVYSYPWLNQEAYQGPSNWLEIVNAETGQLLPDTIPLPNCGAATLATAPAQELMYVACYQSNDLRFVNLETRQVEDELKIPGAPFVDGTYLRTGGKPSSMTDMVLSSDGRELYVVTDDLRIAVVDVALRDITQWVDHSRSDHVAVGNGLVALSADGALLVIGEKVEDEAQGTIIGTRLHVFDTETWQKVDQVQLDQPLHTLVIDPDGQTAYGVTSSFNGKPLPDADTVLMIQLDDPVSKPISASLKRNGEAISRMFIGP